MKGRLEVTPWSGPQPPTSASLSKLLADEGLSSYSWSNGPFDVYSPHSHNYDKVIYVVEGSITFGLPELNLKFTLAQGDRLDLPAGTVHDATVGSVGVVCLEAHY